MQAIHGNKSKRFVVEEERNVCYPLFIQADRQPLEINTDKEVKGELAPQI